MSERRHDEELGRATRFVYDSDHLLEEINKFGEGKLILLKFCTKKKINWAKHQVFLSISLKTKKLYIKKCFCMVNPKILHAGNLKKEN